MWQGKRIIWPVHSFVPYLNDASKQTNLVALAQASGVRFFTLAFIESSEGKTCQATWNTRQPVGSWMRDQIAALRAIGGDVRVAFGGSSDSELAATCTSLTDLVGRYQSVIDAYHLTHLDFDVEGKTLKDTAASKRRNRAIAVLQRRATQAGRQFSISYTLPVKITGFIQSSLDLLRDAVQDGVQISTVNLMVMDYYSQNAPGDQMGQNAISAAFSVFRQFQQLYRGRSAEQLWGMLGLTAMIGVNDNPAEIFTLQDAQRVVSFAEQRQLSLLAFWSLGRDRACGPGQSPPHGCSGVEQQPYDYAQVFTTFATSLPYT
jgi:chitinase